MGFNMTKRRKRNQKQQIPFTLLILILIVWFALQIKNKSEEETLPSADLLKDVSVASVYDGDTFKINLNCSLDFYCEKVPVRVLGVDTPEIKGKTKKEKKAAQKAKKFTKNFLEKAPISLSNCTRDKYFRLLCSVTNGEGKNLADELIKNNLGYEYWGGKKSNQYQ